MLKKIENLTIVPWESVPDWVHWNKILSWHFLCAAREQAKRKDKKIQYPKLASGENPNLLVQNMNNYDKIYNIMSQW